MTIRGEIVWSIKGRRHDQSSLIFEVPSTIADARTVPATAAPCVAHQCSPPIWRGKLTVEGRGEPAAPLRGSNFGDIGWTRTDHEGDTETGNEPTDNELIGMSGSGDDCSPDANDQATHEHADTATEAIPGRG